MKSLVIHEKSLKKRRCLWLKEQKILGIFQASTSQNHLKISESLRRHNLSIYFIKSRNSFNIKGPNTLLFSNAQTSLEEFIYSLITFQKVSKYFLLGVRTKAGIYSPYLLQNLKSKSDFLFSLRGFHMVLLDVCMLKQELVSKKNKEQEERDLNP